MKVRVNIYQDEDGMYIAECPSIPGCVSQGASEADAKSNIAEAIRSANRDWLPFVRVNNRAETVLVYMQQYRNDCRLLVVAIEIGEVTIVELKLNPEALQVWLRAPDAEAVRNVSR